jgi:hypothetical protein
MRLIKYGEEILGKNISKRIDFSSYLDKRKKNYEIFIKTDNDSMVSSFLGPDYFDIETGDKPLLLKWVIVDVEKFDMAYYLKNYPIF